MSKGIFVTGTGTDVGKTYVTALMVKKLNDAGYSAGYYKAALSGAESVEDSDAGYVKRIAGISQENETMVSYLYNNPVSPHLAAKMEGNPVELGKIKADYARVMERYDYVTVEGSGGIVCPLRWDDEKILLEDVVKALSLDVVIVADAGLGTIHSVVTTVSYLRASGIHIKGVILNRYLGTEMHRNNREMIAELSGVTVLACVGSQDTELKIEAEKLADLYE